MEESREDNIIQELCNFTVNHLSTAHSREDENDNRKSHWEAEGNDNESVRNAFDAFDDLGGI